MYMRWMAHFCFSHKIVIVIDMILTKTTYFYYLLNVVYIFEPYIYY